MPLAPACLASARVTASRGPNHRQVCSISAPSFSFQTPLLEWSDESFIRRLGIAHKDKYQNHSQERNYPCNNHNGIEGMESGRLTRVGEISNQLECDDRSDSCARPAEAAYRSHRV